MSDRELIVDFLEKAGRRARFNKRFKQIADILAVAFLLPVGFKILDFFFLFRGRTVTLFFVSWIIATAAWIVWRTRSASALSQIAATIDRLAGLHDQLKTAYWFVVNSTSYNTSKWVDTQIRHAASQAGNLRLDSLFPRRVPRALFGVCGLVLLLTGLNFVPLPFNHNWMLLQAAPAFRLTADERRSLDAALQLLERVKSSNNVELAQKIEEIIQELERGDISVQEAVEKLDALKEELEAEASESASMANGLGQMAAILRRAQVFEPAASSLARGDLGKTSSQMREIGERVAGISAENLRDMAQRMHEASENPRGGLQSLAEAFDSAGTLIDRGDRPALRSAFDRIAAELESIATALAEQKLRSEAGDELAELMDALEQMEIEEGSAGAGKSQKPANAAAGQPMQPGEGGEDGEAQDPEENAESGEGGEGGEGGEPGGESGQAGETPGGNSPDGPNGKGGNAFGGSMKSAPLEGDATSLEVQLQKEALKLELLGGLDPEKDTKAAGERERSKLDYRSVPSDLTPAQKDLLHQERIPRDSRELIKNYFEAVKGKP